MEGAKLYFRIAVLAVILAALMAISGGRLYNLQIVNGDQYRKQSERRILRSSVVVASRGEILDRYGRPLVVNRLSHNLTLDTSLVKKSGLNDVIAKLITACDENGQAYADTLPITAKPYALIDGASSQQTARYERYLKEKSLTGKTPAEVMAFLYEQYGIDPSQDEPQARKMAGVRYELELRELFFNIPAYVFAEDVNMDLIAVIKEQRVFGVNVSNVPIREYKTDFAAHILGRSGPIFEEEYAQLKEQGYAMDAVIGKDGMEKILESWLRGKNGVQSVETNTNGKVTNIIDTQPSEPGKNCVLTIDIRLQETAERALREHIPRLIAEGNQKWGGFDAEGGAVAVIEVKTGEILALASYPTFKLSSFNADYKSLSENPLKPMYNRATMGIYPPGSTFKMCTSVAALEAGVISPSTKILDKGVYMYYAPSYTPACSLWRSSHRTHGNINVVEALKVSCNYFFYEAGRLAGIENIDRVAAQFGLGQPTGIELPENTGVLAGPEYSQKVGATWYPGLTLAASIGQADNSFSPLQLANYVATLVNGGTRYKAHLLKAVKSYDYTQTLVDVKPEAVSTVPMSKATYQTVLQGMRAVAETGTASNVFGNYPVQVGAKTGSAQITSTRSDNGVFVAFAPYENPEIAVAVVVEHGGQGNRVAPIARDIFDTYFAQDGQLESITGENVLLK